MTNTKREINKKDITFEPTYEGHPINADKEKNHGCNKKILNKSLNLFNQAAKKHNKVFYMRMDVRFPKNKENINTDNKQFEGFMNSFNKNLKSNGLDPSYIWTREQSREKHQHYHISLLLNGNKIQNIHKPIQKAEELWSKRLGLDKEQNNALIDNCTKGRNGQKQKNGIMIKRGSHDYDKTFDKCFGWNSYLAKTNTKRYAPKNAKEFGCSQAKSKKKRQ